MARSLSSRFSWIADVLCGAIGGYVVLGVQGAVLGALFMGSAGQVYRRQRLRRERQLCELRAKAAMRRRHAVRGVATEAPPA